VARKYDSSKRKVDRPQKQRDIRKLVVEIALANLGWPTAVAAKLLKESTGAEHGREPGALSKAAARYRPRAT
jgi:hypothetical protein